MKNDSNKQYESPVIPSGATLQPDLSNEIAMQPECHGNDGFMKKQIGKEALVIEQLKDRQNY